MHASIIIVSYNNPGMLRKALRSIQEQVNSSQVETIVVDNASHEGNVTMMNDEFPRVKLLKNDSNLGFGRACNQAARVAAGDVLVFMNSDVVLTGNPLPEPLELLEARNDIGVIGCQLMNPDGSKQPSHFRFPGLMMRFLQLSGLKNVILFLAPGIRSKAGKSVEADYVSGAFLMIKRALFLELGGFDERYFMYMEDADLCYQVKRKGLRVVLLDCDKIIHYGWHVEKVSDSFLMKHTAIGQVEFYRKNFARWKTPVLVCMTIFFLGMRWTYHIVAGHSAQTRNTIMQILRMNANVLIGKSII